MQRQWWGGRPSKELCILTCALDGTEDETMWKDQTFEDSEYEDSLGLLQAIDASDSFPWYIYTGLTQDQKTKTKTTTLFWPFLTVFDSPDKLPTLSYPLEADLWGRHWPRPSLWLPVGFSQWEAMAGAWRAVRRGQVISSLCSLLAGLWLAMATFLRRSHSCWAPSRICSSPPVAWGWYLFPTTASPGASLFPVGFLRPNPHPS